MDIGSVPRGYTHNWSPLTVAPGTSCNDKVLLVHTTESLTAIRVDGGPPASVTVQTGASMESLLQRLEESGYGLTANPAPGDLTVGGVFAIGGHGTAVAVDGETLAPGHTFGSVSNMIVSVTAVVWDPAKTRYVLRTFDRADPTLAALMTHVGRSFVTEVTLRVGANDRLRCQSVLDISAAELFGAPGSSGRTVDSFLMETGRIEVIWFPFTMYPATKAPGVMAGPEVGIQHNPIHAVIGAGQQNGVAVQRVNHARYAIPVRRGAQPRTAEYPTNHWSPIRQCHSFSRHDRSKSSRSPARTY